MESPSILTKRARISVMSSSVLFLVLLMVGCDYDIMVVIQFLFVEMKLDCVVFYGSSPPL
jgi:hypothetical protein